jgi:hypothetical protein
MKTARKAEIVLVFAVRIRTHRTSREASKAEGSDQGMSVALISPEQLQHKSIE